MYCIDEEMKKKLREPLGRLYEDSDSLERINEKKLVVVGDYSLLKLLKKGKKPKIAVVDFETQRNRIDKSEEEKIKKSYKLRIHIKNRRGCIGEHSLKLAKIIEELGINEVLVIVEGEEDLVAIPFILHLKDDEQLIYGIWNKGGVLIKGEDVKKAKRRINELFPGIEKSN